MGSSVGWTTSVDGRGGGRGESGSVLNFGDDDGGGGGDEKTTALEAAALPVVPSALSISASTQSKSIFELSQRYVGLARCSSARTVVPVRLGRSLVPASQAAPASKRPVPPPPDRSGSTNDDGGLARRTCPRATTVVTVMPPATRHKCFAPDSPDSPDSPDAPVAPALGGGCGGGGGTSRQPPVEKKPSPASPSQRSPSSRLAERGDPHTPAEVNDSQGAGSGSGGGGGGGNGGCSRGRRCGASPTHKRSTSSERVGVGRRADLATLSAKKHHKRETYDCPVSPFVAPPSWADVPPLKVEPPWFSRRQPESPVFKASPVEAREEDEEDGEKDEQGRAGSGDSTGPGEQYNGSGDSVEVLAGEREHERQPETSRRAVKPPTSAGNVTVLPPPSSFVPSARFEDRTTATTTMTRPVEKTLYETIAAARRPSYGWGWQRPTGDRVWRRGKKGDPRAALASSLSPSSSLPSRRERERRWGTTNTITSVLPPTS